MKFTAVFIGVTVALIGYAYAHCAKCCNTPNYSSLHGPLKLFYEGEKCDCGRTIPVFVERLRVEPSSKRKSYNYDIYTPPAPPADPGLFSYQYHVEKLKPSPAKERNVLFGHIDRLVVQNRDCEEKVKHPKTDGCGACGNCPCNCHTRTHGDELGDFLSEGNADFVLDFRYDKRKKRFLSELTKPKKKHINNDKKYRSTDDDALLQLSFFKKLKPVTPPVKPDPCASYQYKSCGHRGPNCPDCYNCTCVPAKNGYHEQDLDELVSAALKDDFIIPDKYDPVMRQEVSIEPLQYTDQSMADYQSLTKVLQQRTNMDPKYAGGLLSPPPAQQTQEIIKLLIDLMDNKQDIRAYHQSNSFQNPHDWMHVVDTDSLAYKVGQHKYLDILPLNQLEHENKVKYIDNRPRVDTKLPSRQPSKPLYAKIDTVAELYKTFKQTSPVSVHQLLVPVNQFLEFQAKEQVDDQIRKEKFMNALRIKRDVQIDDNDDKRKRKNRPRDQSVTELGEQVYTKKLSELYRKYKQILRDMDTHDTPSQTPPHTTVLKVRKAHKNESSMNKTVPEFVILKQDPGVLLGDEVATGTDEVYGESDSEVSQKIIDDDDEFIT